MPPLDTFRPEPGHLPTRALIPPRYKWDLTAICKSWDEWQASYKQLDQSIASSPSFQGTLGKGPERLLAAFNAMDEMGALSYRVWYYAALHYDEDQRNNEINARRQQVQILFAKQAQASSWFNPEELAIPIETIQTWMRESTELAIYRFAIEDLYRQQEHVLDEKGEHLLSLHSRFASAPYDA